MPYYPNITKKPSGGGGGTPFLQSITVMPTGSTGTVGGTLQAHATGVFDSGSVANMDGCVNWSTSDSAVVTVGSTGLLTFVSATIAGLTRYVSASLFGVTGTMSVFVQNVDQPILSDTNAVFHLWVDQAGAFHDTKGGTWTQVGTVTKTGGGSSDVGVGYMSGFSAANQYKSGTGADAADFGSGVDYTVALIFKYPSSGLQTSNMQPVSDYSNPSNVGWTLLGDNSGNWHYYRGTTSTSVNNGAAADANGIVMFGQAGSTLWLQCNQGTISNGTTAAVGGAGSVPIQIGDDFDGSVHSVFPGRIYEVLVSTSTPSSASFAALYTAAKAKFGANMP